MDLITIAFELTKFLLGYSGQSALNYALKSIQNQRAFEAALRETLEWYKDNASDTKIALVEALLLEKGPLFSDLVRKELLLLLDVERQPNVKNIASVWREAVGRDVESVDFKSETNLLLNTLKDNLWRTNEFRVYLDSKGIHGAHQKLDTLLHREGTLNSYITTRPSPPTVNAKLQPTGLWNLRELPPNFLERTQELNEIKALVIGSSNKSVGVAGGGLESTSPVKIGVYGMGGIGKTVLAVALTHEAEVRAAFPDGIIWLDFGQNADPVARQREVFRAFGEYPPPFDNWIDGRKELQILIDKRSCLIILDDVWQCTHAEAFTRLGGNCRVLITTRDAGLLKDIGAFTYGVDVLSLDQSVVLLNVSSGDESVQHIIYDVARICGQVPFALVMMGALNRDGRYDWEEIMMRLKAVDLKHLRRKLPDYEYDSLLSAIEVSVEALTEEHHEAYLQCAVFDEDVIIPEAALRVLWSKHCSGEDEATNLAFLLKDRALLTRIGDRPRCYKIHDLHHKYLVATAKANKSLGILHRDFVDNYCERCTNGWDTGPNDGYYFQFLVYHLLQTDDKEAIRDLLLDYAWIKKKLEVTTFASLLSDYVFFKDDLQNIALKYIYQSLRLSSYVLNDNTKEIASQLIGRLNNIDNPHISKLLKQMKSLAKPPWLFPVVDALTQPGNELEQTFMHFDSDCAGVNAIAITPDGQYVVAGYYRVLWSSSENTVKVWNVHSGKLEKSWKGPDWILSIAITSDGKNVVLGSRSPEIQIWNFHKGILIKSLKGHTSWVNAVSLTSCGTYLISGSSDQTIKIWDVNTGYLVRNLEGHTDEVKSIALTSDGNYVVSGSHDCTIKIWNIETGALVKTIEGLADKVNAVVLTVDNHYLVCGLDGGQIEVWNLPNGKLDKTYKGHTDQVNTLALTPNGQYIVSGSNDKTIRVWNLPNGKLEKTYEGHTSWVLSAALSSDGQYVLSGAWDNSIKRWDLSCKPDSSSFDNLGLVLDSTVTSNGRYALLGSCDRIIKFVDIDTGTIEKTFSGHDGWINAVELSIDGLYLISGSRDQTIKVWDVNTGLLVRTLEGHTNEVKSLALTPDGNYVVSGSHDCTIKIWNIKTGSLVKNIEGHTDWVNAVAVTPDGNQIVSGSRDQTIKVWDLHSGDLNKSVKSDVILSLALTHDGEHLLSTSIYESEIRSWNIKSGVYEHSLVGHTDYVNKVLLMPNGCYAVSGSYDKTIKVWDLRSRNCVASFHGEAEITTLAVTNSNVIISCDHSGRMFTLKMMFK